MQYCFGIKVQTSVIHLHVNTLTENDDNEHNNTHEITLHTMATTVVEITNSDANQESM